MMGKVEGLLWLLGVLAMLQVKWCESKELGGRTSVKIPSTNGGEVLCRFSSSYGNLFNRVVYRILSNINDGANLQKYVKRALLDD